ncbi:CaiB/BaiF CoA-transferase family protein [Patulibacter sp.]|uniref:CaiB/BaiF CoA transferase family protein n=1 Tax=Patulibacter sp. TaxID=1912859 RepID=UPI002724171C|nr:CaiB/BaiF CoA-transferase family protein [Patulibacter sp.]MDO9409723.1 CaiB/BaiF CoA-transferase family protein [Patulibacter sp.]
MTSLPLEGVRVLDLSRLLPGPFASLMLADFGADVVKVEDTGAGDYARAAPPYVDGAAESAKSAAFIALNRNKRSIRLDLKAEEGREALLALVEGADVVLESFRPGVMDRLGLGIDALRARNPRIVHCAISGFGQTGPLTQRPGHDMNYLALAGVLALNGVRDGEPVLGGVQIADIGGGAQMAVIGVLTALRHAERTGEGQSVDVSMTDGALSWTVMESAAALQGQQPRRGRTLLTGEHLCYRPYPCADGWITIGALEPKFWKAFCDGVGRDDLIPRQFDPPGSEAHAEVERIALSRTREEWAAFGSEHDACLEPVWELEEALESDLVRAREMVVEIDQPGATGPVRALGVPIKLSATPGDVHRLPAPGLGEHTEEVLREAGLDEDRIAALLSSGAAGALVG